MLRQEPNPDLERVRFEMRATGVRDAKANPHRTGVHTRGYLPHVKREGASYFVTFRLEDSLPRQVLMRFQAERAARLRSLHGKSPAHKPPGPGGLDPKQEVDQEFYREVERYLDKGVGACHLACPEIANAVATSLRFFEGQRY